MIPILTPQGGFNPAQLFVGGVQGAWYDPSDLSTLFQDSAGATPVTAVEQPVGLMKDKSGRGNHAFQTTSANRPVLSALVNLLTKTEQFDNSVWTKQASALSITPDSTTAPDGTATADLATENSADSQRSIYQSVSGPAGTYKVSLYVKGKTGTRYIRVVLASGSGDFGYVTVGINDGSITQAASTSGTATNASAVVSSAGNGWYKISLSATLAASLAFAFFVVLDNGTASVTGGYGRVTYIGDGVSGFYIWGADLRVTNDGVGVPSYQRVNTTTDYDTSGFPLYIKPNGSTQSMVTNSIDFSGTDKMTVWAGVRKLSDAATGVIVENGDPATTNGRFQITASGTNGTDRSSWGCAFCGTVGQASRQPRTYVAPVTNVVSYAMDAAQSTTATQLAAKINGATPGSISDIAGPTTGGNFANAALYLCSDAGTGGFLSGRLYSLIVRGAQSTATQISQGETWVNTKTKAY